MSIVSLLGVKVLNNPAKFTDSYHFEITFECLEQLQKGRAPHAIPYSGVGLNRLQILNGSSPMSAQPPRMCFSQCPRD